MLEHLTANPATEDSKRCTAHRPADCRQPSICHHLLTCLPFGCDPLPRYVPAVSRATPRWVPWASVVVSADRVSLKAGCPPWSAPWSSVRVLAWVGKLESTPFTD